MEMIGGGKDVLTHCRKDTIMGDAAYVIFTRDSRNFTGNFCIDDEILKEAGVTDFDQYAVSPGINLIHLLVCILPIGELISMPICDNFRNKFDY